jgi:shikimate dehydrogenase
LAGEMPALPASLLAPGAVCYDMMYAAQATIFMRWAAERGARASADGLGMLVEQAAQSFFLWRQRRPQTKPVIALLRGELLAR